MKLSWASDGDSKVLRSIAHLPPSHSSCFLLSVNILATGHWAHVTCTSIIKMVIVCMTSLNLNTWLEADILISMVLMRALRLTDVQQLGYGPTDISVRCGFSSRAPESQARLFRVACHCLLHSIVYFWSHSLLIHVFLLPPVLSLSSVSSNIPPKMPIYNLRLLWSLFANIYWVTTTY